jgi:hypothetical protein
MTTLARSKALLVIPVLFTVAHCGGAVASPSTSSEGGADTASSGGGGSGSGSGSGTVDASGSVGSTSSSGSSGSGSSSGTEGSSGGGSSGAEDASLADVSLPPGCAVGPTTCDLCLAQSCCAQVDTCKQDATCVQALKCLVSCERNGASGFACAEGECNKPSDQATTDLFSCGFQGCPSPCTAD